jgi:hypothetical protein
MLVLAAPSRQAGAICGRLAILAALAAALLAAPAVAAGAPSEIVGDVQFYPFSVDAENASCAQVTDTPVGPTYACDPVNLVFPGQSLAAVVARLHAAGWIDVAASVQSLVVGEGSLVPATAQLAEPDGPDPTQRYHVRLWEAAPTVTLGNVHHERGSPHAIDRAWDDAEAHLAAPLCSTWCGHVAFAGQQALQGGPAWRGWGNDGVATMIAAHPPDPQKPRKPKKRRRPPAGGN